jgi:hypothetical protein
MRLDNKISTSTAIPSTSKTTSPAAQRPSSRALDHQSDDTGQSLAEDEAGSDDDEADVFKVRGGSSAVMGAVSLHREVGDEPADQTGD